MTTPKNIQEVHWSRIFAQTFFTAPSREYAVKISARVLYNISVPRVAIWIFQVRTSHRRRSRPNHPPRYHQHQPVQISASPDKKDRL